MDKETQVKLIDTLKVITKALSVHKDAIIKLKKKVSDLENRR